MPVQPKDMYLIRAGTFQYAKYSNVQQIDITGAKQVYSSVTGVAATDTLTIVGNTLQNDFPVYFQAIDGGAGLSVDTTYWVISASGNTFKLAATKGGSAINFTTNIVSGTLIYSNDEILVWSSAFRDVFNGLGAQQGACSGLAGGGYGAPQGYGIGADPDQALSVATYTPPGGAYPTNAYIAGTPKVFISDDVAHHDLRQTALRKSFWRFDYGSGELPRYGYAEVLAGDIIADNPPNT